VRLEDALQSLIPVALPAGARAGERLARDLALADADRRRWRGLALYAADVANLRVTPSRANREHFATMTQVQVQPAAEERGNFAVMSSDSRSTRPYVEVGALFGLRSQLVVDAVIAARQAEPWQFQAPERSVIFFDERLALPEVLVGVARSQGDRHFIAPAGQRSRWRTVKVLDQRNSDCLVEVRVPFAMRRAGESAYVLARAIEYHRPGYPSQSLITSLLDAGEWPFHEIVAMHSERWVGLFGARRGVQRQRAPIEGDGPEAVHARLWALLRAHDLMRQALCACAETLAVEPCQLDFKRAVDRAGAEALASALARGSVEPLLAALGPAAAELLVEPAPAPLRIDVVPRG
jgi:hypothetical protein